MRAVPIAAARDLGKRSGARRLVIIAIDGDDYGITTWGETKAECRALAKWAESKKADRVLAEISGADVENGYVHVALLPGGEAA